MSVTRILLIIAVLILMACHKDEEPKPKKEKKPIKTSWSIDCDNECVFADDGECDDGGEGSTSDLCGLGHDCHDCGKRRVIYVKK